MVLLPKILGIFTAMRAWPHFHEEKNLVAIRFRLASARAGNSLSLMLPILLDHNCSGASLDNVERLSRSGFLPPPWRGSHRFSVATSVLIICPPSSFAFDFAKHNKCKSVVVPRFTFS